MITQFALGSRVECKISGIVYTKTALDYWQPTPEGASFGWQPFTATDDFVRTEKLVHSGRPAFMLVAGRGACCRRLPSIYQRLLDVRHDQLAF